MQTLDDDLTRNTVASSGCVGSIWLLHCSLLFGVKLLISVFARQHWSDLELDFQNSCCQTLCIKWLPDFHMTKGKKECI